MAKYTIETDGNTADNIDGYLGIRIELCNKRTWVKTDLELTQYTEPDLDAIRKEAYYKGYETGYKDGYHEPGKNQQEAYQRGLNDAWDAARKIGSNSMCSLKEMGFKFEPQSVGYNPSWYVVQIYSASECIEKIRQYEQEKEEIQVGDEVEFCNGEKSVVLVVEDGKPVKLLEADGYTTTADGDLLSSMKKTGRTFPEIAEVLEKMRGE